MSVQTLSRRHFLLTAAAFSVACGTSPGTRDGGDSGGRTDAAAPRDAAIDAGPALLWREIPALTFTLGVSVELNLRAYLDEPRGAAAITLDMPLPAGLSLEGGVIRGTPTGVAPAAEFVATADDGV